MTSSTRLLASTAARVSAANARANPVRHGSSAPDRRDLATSARLTGTTTAQVGTAEVSIDRDPAACSGGRQKIH